MIFEETEDGMSIYITHEELMTKTREQYIDLMIFGRNIYRSHAYADMDVDNPDGE